MNKLGPLVQGRHVSNALAIFGNMDEGPPKDIFEAAQRGVTPYITKQVDRTIEFDINQRDKLGRTALHWAAEMGHLETAEALLDYGTDVAATECNGRTAVHLAARSCDAEMLRAILRDKDDAEKAALVNQTDNFGITPVFLTLQKGEDGRAAFEYLMVCGAKYNEMKVVSAHTALTPVAAVGQAAAAQS